MAKQRTVPCSGCGDLLYRDLRVLQPQMCRACRVGDRFGARAHDAVAGTRFGRDWHRARAEAPCNPCRDAWNTECKKRREKAIANGWRRPDRPPPTRLARPAACSKCENVLPVAYSDSPMCSRCRHNKPGRTIKVSPTQRLDIYRRDGWTCQICLEGVDRGLHYSDTWAATLDHILPRAHGGTDAVENLRLAHRWCNSVRGDLRYYNDEALQIG